MEVEEYYNGYYIGYELNKNFNPNIEIADFVNDDQPAETLITTPNGVPMGTITDYGNGLPLQDLFIRYRSYFEDFVIINQDSLKFQAVDRYYHYYIEVPRLLRKIEKHIEVGKDQRLLIKYFTNCMRYYQNVSASNAFSIFGIKDLERYLLTKTALVINSPSIIGLYYLTSDKETFQRIVYHDFLYSDLSLENRHLVFNRLIYAIRDARNRMVLPYDDDRNNSLMNSFIVSRAIGGIHFQDLIENYESEEKLKSQIHERLLLLENEIANQLKELKIQLMGKLTQGVLVQKICEKIGKKFADKKILINKKESSEIKSAVRMFVAKNTRNKGGNRQMLPKEGNIGLLYEHIDVLKVEMEGILKSNEDRGIDLTKLLKRNFPNYEISTIKNK